MPNLRNCSKGDSNRYRSPHDDDDDDDDDDNDDDDNNNNVFICDELLKENRILISIDNICYTRVFVIYFNCALHCNGVTSYNCVVTYNGFMFRMNSFQALKNTTFTRSSSTISRSMTLRHARPPCGCSWN